MDTITHTVLGACLGEMIAGKQLGKKAMLLGALANNIPDLDVVTSLWMSHAASLLAHRGFTHSFLFVLLGTSLLASLSVRFSKYRSISFNRWMLLWGTGLFLHIFLDAFTVYGTGWFEPFSHQRISFNTLFIVDPLLTLPLLVAALVLLVLKKSSPKRKSWAKAGLMMSSAYLLVTIGVKLYVNEKIEQSLLARQLSYSDYMATPTPFNIFLWYIVARNHAEFHTGYYSVFDKSFPIELDTVQRNDSLITSIYDTDDLNKIIRFSEGYYLFSSQNDTISINDMRFGQIGGWYLEDAPYVFSYSLQKDADNSIVLQRGRIEGNSGDAFAKLIERVKGK